jgi:hypothetical protein
MPNIHVDPILHERVARLIAASRGPHNNGEYLKRLNELVELYGQVGDQALAQDMRRAFLLMLENTPDVLADERLSSFLAETVEPEDFATLQWKTPIEVVTYCDMLYSFRFHSEALAGHVRTLVQNLLRYALQQYERDGKHEKMFELLRLMPGTLDMDDVELLRLRNRAHLYEMRRTRRSRRLLYGYLVLQLILVFAVFPLLFINAENGAIQDEAQKLGVDLPKEGRRFFSYADGLYWSLITAASIGYGDITPQTSVSRVIAATLGIMGVITIGVIAGLILNWITARSID